MFFYVHGKLSNLKFNFQILETNIQETCFQQSIKYHLEKDLGHYIKEFYLFGEDRFHIQLLNLLLFKKSSNFFMTMFLQKENKIILNQLNLELHLCQVTLLVFFVLLFLIQQILWFQRFIQKTKNPEQ